MGPTPLKIRPSSDPAATVPSYVVRKKLTSWRARVHGDSDTGSVVMKTHAPLPRCHPHAHLVVGEEAAGERDAIREREAWPTPHSPPHSVSLHATRQGQLLRMHWS